MCSIILAIGQINRKHEMCSHFTLTLCSLLTQKLKSHPKMKIIFFKKPEKNYNFKLAAKSY